MLVVSSREFREKQAEYMDRADNGEQIIVQRGENKAYALTPVTDDGLYFNTEMLARIKQSIEQVREGNVTTVKTVDALKSFLNAL